MAHTSVHLDIIIPAYNAHATLTRTLSSLRKQTDPRWHATVVDDGSEPSIIIDPLFDEDSRISLVQRPHLGVSAARNYGFDHTHNPYACFLDADDTLDPQFVESMLAIAPHAELAAACGYCYVSQDTSILCSMPPATLQSISLPQSLALDPPALMSLVFRRETLRQLNTDGTLFNESLKVYEDWDLLTRLTSQHRSTGQVYVQSNCMLAQYHCTPSSASSDVPRLWQQGSDLIRAYCPTPDSASTYIRRWSLGLIAACVICDDTETFAAIQSARGPLMPDEIARLVNALRWHSMRRLAIPLGSTDLMRADLVERCRTLFGDSPLVQQIDDEFARTSTNSLRKLLHEAHTTLKHDGRIVIYGLGRNGTQLLSLADSLDIPVCLADDATDLYATDPRRIPPHSIHAHDVVLVTPLDSQPIVRRLAQHTSCRVIQCFQELVSS